MRRFYQILQRWLPFYWARLAGTILWGTTIGLFTLADRPAMGAYLWSQEAITIGTVFLIFYYTDLLSNQLNKFALRGSARSRSYYRIQELFQVQSKLSGGEQPCQQAHSP